MLALGKGTGLALLALAAGGALQASVGGNPDVDFRQTYSLGPHGRVVIQNLYGDVSITAWDREEVLVEAVKRSADPSRRDDVCIVVEPSVGLLSIRTQYAGSGAGRPASVEYRITVPRTTSLENIKLFNGGLSISGVSGPVKASAINGSIKAEKLEGSAELSTVNGELVAGFNRVSSSQPISLRSVNGPITLSIPRGSGASLNAHNLSGGIETDFGRVSQADSGRQLHTVVNRGGAAIHVENVNGGISIHSTWSRRPQRPLI